MTGIIDRITAIVGPAGVIAGEAARELPADWLGFARNKAKAWVRPKTTEEVSAVLRACHEARQTVVPAGGLSGLVRGTAAEADDIVLSLERMSEIEAIDPAAATATVQAGVRLQTLQEAAREKGLEFAMDIGSRGSCMIGGNIATNAGGAQVLRYGMMRDQVLGLEAVLADGRIVSSMNALLKNNAGYDIKQLFIGSEGTLGIVTRAVLRLRPGHDSELSAFIGADSFDAVIRLLGLLSRRSAGTLTAFEVMWRDFYRLATADASRHRPPLADDAGYYILAELRGADVEGDRERLTAALSEAANEGWIRDATLAQSKAQGQAFWAIRENVGTVAVALSPCFVFDISLPLSAMPAYLETLRSALEGRYGEQARMAVFGHLGDGNLHLMITVGEGRDEAREGVEALVYRPLAAAAGSISAEHGVGLEKRPWLGMTRNESEITLMRTLKQALDPHGVLNPGKVI